MKPKAIPKDCRNCIYLWTQGAKDGKHDRWCCYHSKPAPDVYKHCILLGVFTKVKEK